MFNFGAVSNIEIVLLVVSVALLIVKQSIIESKVFTILTDSIENLKKTLSSYKRGYIVVNTIRYLILTTKGAILFFELIVKFYLLFCTILPVCIVIVAFFGDAEDLWSFLIVMISLPYALLSTTLEITYNFLFCTTLVFKNLIHLVYKFAVLITSSFDKIALLICTVFTKLVTTAPAILSTVWKNIYFIWEIIYAWLSSIGRGSISEELTMLIIIVGIILKEITKCLTDFGYNVLWVVTNAVSSFFNDPDNIDFNKKVTKFLEETDTHFINITELTLRMFEKSGEYVILHIYWFKESVYSLSSTYLLYFNILLNILYNSALCMYVFTLVFYAIIRFTNYVSIVRGLNNIILLLCIITGLKLLINTQVWSTSSEVRFNNALITFNLLSMYYDNLTMAFLFTIYTISFIVHKYQFAYLKDSNLKEKFLITLNFFILSMVCVVSTSNWIVLLLAWELLGLTSFMLIGYYKTKPTAMKSAIKAFTFNKMSDVSLLVSFLVYVIGYTTFNLTQQIDVTPWYELTCVLILVTAFIKSAQFCFYFWLPDSMEAPIPASALIHSATLVSAGIYLTLRTINFTEISNIAQILLFIVSTSTMVTASLIAYNQTDIKKLLAYSTIANCGFIYFLIFLKLYKIALLYFIVHGVIKSFSFVVAGDLITANNHLQDIRKWVNFNLESRLKLLLLALLLLLLSGAPISLVYTIKNNLYCPNYYGPVTHIIGALSILSYTLSSYLYGLKLILFVLNKNMFYDKYRKDINKNNDTHLEISRLFILYLYTLISILIITSSAVTATGFLSLKCLISIVIVSTCCVYITVRNELIYIQFLIFLTTVLYTFFTCLGI